MTDRAATVVLQTAGQPSRQGPAVVEAGDPLVMARGRSHLNRLPVAAVLLLAVLAAACASTPPDRIAYTTIDTATEAVQTAMRAFNDLYQQGKLTDQDRLKVLEAYSKYQTVARAAVKLAQASTGPNPDMARIISDAAVEALQIIEAFTGRK